MGCANSIVDVHIEDFPLRKCDVKNTEKFLPKVSRVRVISVYDGDTVTVAARLGHRGKPYQFKVRLNRIDTAEMRSHDAAEKQAALEAKEALSTRVLNKGVTLKHVSYEKYGRILADVYYKGVCINDWMLSGKFAVPYDGGKKVKVDWANYRHPRGNLLLGR